MMWIANAQEHIFFLWLLNFLAMYEGKPIRVVIRNI
jgi:hypothetical protein